MQKIFHPEWKKRIILFLISQCITLFGSTLVQMAIVWYATMETASGIWVAAFTVCSYLPQFLISFLGGVWADRYSRKLLIGGADGVIAAVTLILLMAVPHLSSETGLLWGLLAASLLRSLGAGIQAPAVNAVIPLLVPEEHLIRYNGINAAMQSLVQFAAPAAAGIIFSVSSLPATLMIDILTAAAGIGILLFIPLPKQRGKQEEASVFSDMKTGLNYAFSNRRIGRLLLVYGLFTFLCVPGGFLAGLLVRRTYGDTYWYLTAVELTGFAGMISGGLLMSLWGGLKSQTGTLLAGYACFGLSAVGMGLSGSFLPYLVFMLFYGIAMTAVQTSATTLLQKNADITVQGRVFGLMGTMYSGFLPLGMMVFGPMADLIPLNRMVTASGIALMGIAGVLYRWKLLDA
ncbi:MFS transporter [Clostridium sp. MCC353]|uniref:MFS transporter n=1 Tax=Clostridium sp. MCC353 TaxID=2592646 RepID=UPI001C00E1E8|nr:MFS transporter [Clostridium sp. MCC353]MBT9776781.1 MFS transporter [Clostridium sp. MCC353]